MTEQGSYRRRGREQAQRGDVVEVLPETLEVLLEVWLPKMGVGNAREGDQSRELATGAQSCRRKEFSPLSSSLHAKLHFGITASSIFNSGSSSVPDLVQLSSSTEFVSQLSSL
ncbi:hypothetical protein HHK36_019973 [Tetracentron sinense]|uniref:Uncharacterized protein n=1 Tax=Tetracentron sinense TaxID=13715 RepID=A0A834YU79_TETSI|nr:hypothetical protein HHK36_019973 [Tetracentron sinense]